MKCQNCGQNETVFFQRSNVNGYIHELNLCAECAEKLGAIQNRRIPMFDEFFSGFGMAFPFGGYVPVVGFAPRAAAPRFAGLTTEQMPAAVQQTAEVDEGVKRHREVNMLREQMKRAAESEDFEKAISLREEIKRLET